VSKKLQNTRLIPGDS
jgi:hypothetical protein